MDIKNQVLKDCIKGWNQRSTSYNKAFELHQAFIEIVDVNCEYYGLTSKQLSDFIDGVVATYLYLCGIYKDNDTKMKQLYNESLELTKPVYDKIVAQAKSDGYRKFIVDQQITGEKTFEFAGVKGKIDRNEILLHINRTGKNPLTPKDIGQIEKDYVKYCRDLYEVEGDSVKQVGKNKPGTTEMNLDLLDNLFVLGVTKGNKPTKLDIFKNDLKTFVSSYNGIQITALALFLHESGVLHKNISYDHFSDWKKVFCNIVGVKEPTYKPGRKEVQVELEKMKKTYCNLIP